MPQYGASSGVNERLARLVKDAVRELLHARDRDAEARGYEIDLHDAEGQRIATVVWPLVPQIGHPVRLYADRGWGTDVRPPDWIRYRVDAVHLAPPFQSADRATRRLDLTVTVTEVERAKPERAW